MIGLIAAGIIGLLGAYMPPEQGLELALWVVGGGAAAGLVVLGVSTLFDRPTQRRSL